MKRVLLGLALLACAAPAEAAPAPSVEIHPVPFRAAYDAHAYDFLKDALGDRTIVQLGESIHVTDELPRARLPFVRYLHEELDFDVIAFEGSLVGSWLAEDVLYRSKDPLPAKIDRAQELAWFGLWQTPEMREVLEYVASTQTTPHPLYLASFDLQVGTSWAFRGDTKGALDAFSAALATYGLPPLASAPLANALECFHSPQPKTPEEDRAALDAITALESHLDVEKVAAASSQYHAAALALVPESVRQALQLCQEVRREGVKVYQANRDSKNAESVIRLHDALSESRRVILWAHHTHVQHDTRKNLPSMGRSLLLVAPDDLYTIGFFAGDGRALQVDDNAFPPMVPRTIRAGSSLGLETLLGQQSDDDFFVDFTRIDPKSHHEWYEPQSTRIETKLGLIVIPARDFHAAVFVHEVHPPPLGQMMPKPIAAALTVYGFIRDHVIACIVALVALIGLWIRSRRRRARLRPSTPPA